MLAGRLFANEIAEAILPEADLVVVPAPWLRGLPSHATAKRATRAAQVATTYLKAPLDLRFTFHDDIPF